MWLEQRGAESDGCVVRKGNANETRFLPTQENRLRGDLTQAASQQALHITMSDGEEDCFTTHLAEAISIGVHTRA